MIVLDSKESNAIRQKYIKTFVNTMSTYYIDKISKVRKFSDGFCYVGYLWDCLINPIVVPESECISFVKQKINFYIMWDIHSAERILVPNYWKYPKNSVLFVERWVDNMNGELPEDIYLFDNSFAWSAVFTHETDLYGKRLCILNRKRQTKKTEDGSEKTGDGSVS